MAETEDEAMCHCTHLTNFVIRVDNSTNMITEDFSISYFIVIGPAVTILCVLLVLLLVAVTR